MSSNPESQLASAVLMIRPVRFASNTQTAASNRFQGKSTLDAATQNENAQLEFDAMVEKLRAASIDVVVVNDTDEPHTPDSIFPNNWVSFHNDGRVVLYPMEAQNRRLERRTDILERLTQDYSCAIKEVVDLSRYEQSGCFLEGTGSLVLDRANRIAYACLSTRTHLEPLGEFAQRMDYEVVAFDAVDPDGAPIYHTNVLMNVGETLAAICSIAIKDESQRVAVLRSLADTGHEVVDLSYEQLAAFAGNMLELRTGEGQRLVVLSQQAYDTLDDKQRAKLHANGQVLPVAIPVIEASAGGSVRCMLAELHLPMAKAS